ncbi:transglycosylase SLT domain-containing protein [Aquabacterium sp.]|uniref:transglycosylase SLT domain-containing protein n=1 Tax=Aquabacterium sp. TaxID=1872578 RepID=UPI0037831C1C
MGGAVERKNMTAISKLRALNSLVARSAGVFMRDVGAGLLEVSHNSLALLGLCVVAAAVFAGGRADVRDSIEQQALGWLLARQEAREPVSPVTELAEPDAVARATAVDLNALPRQQKAVVQWLSRRYRVAPEPVGALVQEAWQVGQRTGIEPTLILAVMAIESSFNPFAQSPVGAQGLMQVMTRIHDDKYEAFGGTRAAFDPVTNLRVGALVLKECIARAGSLEAGLRHYVGAATLGEDGGYVVKVLAEQLNLRRVADGKLVAVNTPLPSAASAAAAVAAPAETSTPKPAAEQVALLR